MTVFVYDKTFEGLLTAVFDAYSRRGFPDRGLAEGELFPCFFLGGGRRRVSTAEQVM